MLVTLEPEEDILRWKMCHVKDSKLETVCPLMGGHTATVRCLQWDYKVSVCSKE